MNILLCSFIHVISIFLYEYLEQNQLYNIQYNIAEPLKPLPPSGVIIVIDLGQNRFR